MKKYLVVFLLAVLALLLLTVPMVLAEAVDPAPVPLLEEAQFFDVAILGTFAGTLAAAEILVLIIKWLFKLEGNALRYTVVGCSVLTVAAGRFMGGDSITLTNIVLTLLNGGVVSTTLMKLYEVTAGYSKTPAGTITS